MTAFALIGAAALGTYLAFGANSVMVGIVLMVCGVLGLIVFVGTATSHRRPGETGSVMEERHYFGDQEDERHRYRR